jgi:hypothetical protein
MSQCEADGSRGFHGIKGSEPRVYPGNWAYTALCPEGAETWKWARGPVSNPILTVPDDRRILVGRVNPG